MTPAKSSSPGRHVSDQLLWADFVEVCNLLCGGDAEHHGGAADGDGQQCHATIRASKSGVHGNDQGICEWGWRFGAFGDAHLQQPGDGDEFREWQSVSGQLFGRKFRELQNYVCGGNAVHYEGDAGDHVEHTCGNHAGHSAGFAATECERERAREFCLYAASRNGAFGRQRAKSFRNVYTDGYGRLQLCFGFGND